MPSFKAARELKGYKQDYCCSSSVPCLISQLQSLFSMAPSQPPQKMTAVLQSEVYMRNTQQEKMNLSLTIFSPGVYMPWEKKKICSVGKFNKWSCLYMTYILYFQKGLIIIIITFLELLVEVLPLLSLIDFCQLCKPMFKYKVMSSIIITTINQI